MPTRRGEILEHGDTIEPPIGSTHVTVRATFMHRAMRRRFRTPLKDQQPRGAMLPTPGPHARQAVVKVWQPTPKTTGRHLSYLTREGAGEDGRRAELFTAEGRALDRRAFVRTAQEDPGQYRLMLSLQDHHLVNLPQLTRALMQHVERDVLQANVDWVATVHGGEHPHVHVLMRGVDANGHPVHFTHDYRLRSMRYQVQALLTRWLGEVDSPADTHALDTWVESHVKEAQRMQDHLTDADVPMPVEPLKDRRLSPEEVQRRMEETRQRLQQTIGRMQARHGQDPAPMPSALVLQRLGPAARQAVETVMAARPSVGAPLSRNTLASLLTDLQRGERPEVLLRHYLPEFWKGIRQAQTPDTDTSQETRQSPTPENRQVTRDRNPDGSMGMDL